MSRDDIKILTAWFSLKVASHTHTHTNGDFYRSFDETMVISKNVYLQLIKARLWKLTAAVVYDVNWVKTEKALLSFLLNFGILLSQFDKSYILLELWTSLSSLWLRSCTQERNTVRYVSTVKAIFNHQHISQRNVCKTLRMRIFTTAHREYIGAFTKF